MKKIISDITKTEFFKLFDEYEKELELIGKLVFIHNCFGGVKYNIRDKYYFIENIDHVNFDENNIEHVEGRKKLDETIYELITDDEYKIYIRKQKMKSLL